MRLQDAFPHDVLMDFNGGLSFKKGCYVGQEVVSRMQHRGTARRRVVTVTAETALPASGHGDNRRWQAGRHARLRRGNEADLAIVRIDRAGEAMASGTPLLAGDVSVTLEPARLDRAQHSRLDGGRGQRVTTAKAPRAWQRMLSGRRLDLLDPSPLDVEVSDIAHGLARVARWNGQTSGDHAFSVAQHCLVVEDIFRRFNDATRRAMPDGAAA